MHSSPSRIRNLRRFTSDEYGFSGTQKALGVLLALGLILLVTRIIMGGASQGADKAQAMLEEQNAGGGVTWAEGNEGTAIQKPPKSITAEEDSGGWLSDAVGGVLNVAHDLLSLGSMLPGPLGFGFALADGTLSVIEGDDVDIRLSWEGVTIIPSDNDDSDAPVMPATIPPDASLDKNIQEAQNHSVVVGGAPIDVAQYIWFYNKVRAGSDWDYKKGGQSQNENFGNFNFGAAGKAMGIPEDILLRMAGWAQTQAGTKGEGHPWDLSPHSSYGDDPKDQYWIKQGFQYYDNWERQQPHVTIGPVTITPDF